MIEEKHKTKLDVGLSIAMIKLDTIIYHLGVSLKDLSKMWFAFFDTLDKIKYE